MKRFGRDITAELKQETLREVARGRSERVVTLEFDVSEKSIYRWQKAVSAQRESGEKTMNELQAEVRALRKRAERAEVEASILIKAALFFSNSNTRD